jgi:uncharacterized iron-regulated membrane protein
MPEKKRKLLQWAKHQKDWWGKWHLYLGIIAGLIVSIVGVTGSILVFQDEIDEALNPGLFHVLEQKNKIPLEHIVPMIKEKHPQLEFDYIYNEHDKPNGTYQLYDEVSTQQVYINPYTVEISGKRLYSSSFISIVTNIHRTLLIPVAGRYIVGISSLILLILTITGMRLWIPQKWKQLKSALTINTRAGFKRKNYDWHNVLGFYSSPVVALLSLTGFCITFSLIVVPLLFILSGKSPQGVAQVLGARSAYTKGAQQLPLTAVAEIAYKTIPDARIAGIALPEDSVGNYRLDLEIPGPPKSGNRAMLIIDQYSGKILLNSRIDFPNIGNAYLSWLTPIHYGSFGGRPTQILALVGGLIPLLLFITGFIIWWPRYRKQKKNENRRAAKQAVQNNNTDIENGEGITQERLRYGWVYFTEHCKKGFRQALWVMAIGIIFGALYGLFSGLIVQPAVFAFAFTAVLVVANFIVALISFVFGLVFLAPFRKMNRRVIKYFAVSLSFTIVFTAVYIVLLNTGLTIF